MKKHYKILYQDNMNAYYLDDIFSNEDDAWNYIDDNGLNDGYSLYRVEEYKHQEVAQMFDRSDLKALIATVVIIVLGYGVMHLLLFLHQYFKLTIY